MDIEKILTEDIVPTLTDMKNNQYAFWDAFAYSHKQGTPIKNILELGVYAISDGVPPDLPGQTTKIFMTLCDHYKSEIYVSLDIDKNCINTINRCKSWVEQRGVQVKNHHFVAQDSLKFNVKDYFPNGLDLILLDTNHDHDYPSRVLGFKGTGGAGSTYKEICYYAPHLSKNGRLFLHDTKMYYVERAYGMNTEGAIQRFLDENPEYDFYEHDKNNVGLGEIFRKDSNVANQYKKEV